MEKVRKKRQDFHDDFSYDCYLDELFEEVRSLTLQNKYLLAQRTNYLEKLEEFRLLNPVCYTKKKLY